MGHHYPNSTCTLGVQGFSKKPELQLITIQDATWVQATIACLSSFQKRRFEWVSSSLANMQYSYWTKGHANGAPWGVSCQYPLVEGGFCLVQSVGARAARSLSNSTHSQEKLWRKDRSGLFVGVISGHLLQPVGFNLEKFKKQSWGLKRRKTLSDLFIPTLMLQLEFLEALEVETWGFFLWGLLIPAPLSPNASAEGSPPPQVKGDHSSCLLPCPWPWSFVLFCLFVCFSTFIYFNFFNFWLCWVFVAARGLSLVAASRGYSSLWCTGSSLQWLLLLLSKGSRRAGFNRVASGLSSCGLRALERRLSSCGAQAQLLRGMWNLPIRAEDLVT